MTMKTAGSREARPAAVSLRQGGGSSDRRSQRSLVVAHCLLAQCVRAAGLAKYFPGPVVPVLEFCISNEINIVQLPCPETLFSNPAGGLPRNPHGKAFYERLGFREHCAAIAKQQAAYLRQLIGGGVRVLAVVGMEFSPACAVNYLNRGRRIVRSKGIFVEEFERELLALGLNLRFIGVNQRALKKLHAELTDLVAGEG